MRKLPISALLCASRFLQQPKNKLYWAL